MEKLGLNEIAKAVSAEYCGDIFISSVCTDTRKIKAGCLFIAIEGERFDGHSFIPQAFEKGAAAVISHKEVDCSGAVLKVENTRKAYLDLAGYYRDKFDIPLIGLTGSVGKTTTKEFVALAMSAKYKTLKTEGNLNNDIGMPEMLLRLDSSYEAAVIEMGMNHFGEIHNLVTRSKPTMGIITNIGVSHIENLGSRNGILKAKLELLDGLKEGAPLIVNGDDDKLSTVSLDSRKVYFFGIDNDRSDFRASDIHQTAVNTEFIINWGEGSQRIEIPTIGIHNVYNALAAFAAAYLNGVSPEKIAEALKKYVPSGMRQRVVNCGDFTVIEDCYNASPDSMKASIIALSGIEGGKKIAVLADMLELGDYSVEAHREIGKFAADKGVNVVLAYGSFAEEYSKAAKKAGVKAQLFDDKALLLEALLGEIEKGSVILFKGSHGMHLEETIKALYERKGING